MGLMMPGPRGVGYLNNLSATPGTISTRGTAVVAAGSANTKGSWTQLFAAASVLYSVIGFSIVIGNNSLASSARRSFIDIGVGGSGSEQVIVENLCALGCANLANQPSPQEFYFPIRIAPGTRISARHQCSAASQTSNIVITLYYGNWAEHTTFAGAEMVGANTGTTSLVTITAGNTGTESSWTDIGGTTSKVYYGGCLCITMDTGTALTAIEYHGEWGFNSTAMGEVYFGVTANELIGGVIPGPFQFANIAAGTQLQARAECRATGEALQYGIMCLY